MLQIGFKLLLLIWQFLGVHASLPAHGVVWDLAAFSTTNLAAVVELVANGTVCWHHTKFEYMLAFFKCML